MEVNVARSPRAGETRTREDQKAASAFRELGWARCARKPGAHRGDPRLDKATRVATEAGNDAVASALDAARATHAPALTELGLRMPEPRAAKKRRAKGQAA